MKFNDFDQLMRQYEEALDQTLLPNLWPLVRLDGRNFGQLVKANSIQSPFDTKLHQAMVQTAQRLMNCGFQGIYAYTESDEISVLFHKKDRMFQRKIRKWLSVLAGEASAAFTHALGSPGVLDARICPIPDVETVIDYFRWRQESCQRTALQQACYWALIHAGKSAYDATQALVGRTYEQKLEILRDHGVLYKSLPPEFRLGTGLCWQNRDKPGINPKDQQARTGKRKILVAVVPLPKGEEYTMFLKEQINKNK